MPSRPAPLLGEPIALELANTRFAHRGHEHDALREPADLAEWLGRVRERLPRAPGDRDLDAIGPGELNAARALRDALRSLFTAATAGTAPDADATETVNRAARAAPSWRELATNGAPAAVARTAASPVTAALAAIADDAVGLLTGPDAGALRACAAPGCMLFYRKDHPRRAWCSARCSNRVRAARHYARRTDARPDPGATARIGAGIGGKTGLSYETGPRIGVDMDDDKARGDAPEDQPQEPGAEGGSGGSADVPPAVPSDDDSALGDTDQHSDAQA